MRGTSVSGTVKDRQHRRDGQTSITLSLGVRCALVVAVLAAAAAVVAPALTSAAAGSDILRPGESLVNGQFIQSSDSRKRLVMQSDGNLVLLYRASGTWAAAPRIVWASNTPGNSGARLVLQGDGNLVIYRRNGTPAWATGTFGNHHLRLQSDGNLVMYRSGGGAVWALNIFSDLTAASYNQGAGKKDAAGNNLFPSGYKAVMDSRTYFIGDQEICGHRLAQTSDPRPMTKSFGVAKPDGCGGNGFGNALRVAWSAVYTAPIVRAYSARDPQDQQTRGVICQRGSLRGQRATVCSTHLTAGSGALQDAARRSQQAELLSLVAAVRNPGDLLIISGDFNSSTTSVMAANGLGLRRVAANGIDQIWSNGEALGSWTISTSLSDHRQLYAAIG